jgi:putative transcriptional regulator
VKKADLNKKIGQRIIALREKKGLSQSDLARACSKDRQAIEKLENGRVNPTLFTLYEVAKALEIPLSAITDIKI